MSRRSTAKAGGLSAKAGDDKLRPPASGPSPDRTPPNPWPLSRNVLALEHMDDPKRRSAAG
jgi:hypothetical protein